MQTEGFRATALRYRPQVFAELVGQEHVSLTLTNAITGGRIAHAFLFSGPRGVGKTSAARILAKSLNCEQGPTPSPCGGCASCAEITESRALDVYEIDGASNRGIEQIRDLKESVRFAPTRGRYKIYIIDEVHMLTNEAFNALLKTLEEPPPSVIFIFATTEAAKVKITIRSRCQQYRFHRIQARRIQERLASIAAADGIPADEEALFMIARAADGSMRDAESLFDQIASYALEGITARHVREMLGSIDASMYFDFLTFLIEEDFAELLERIARMDNEGFDFIVFTQGLADVLRNLVLLASGASPDALELTAEDCADLKSFLDPSSADGFSLDDAVTLLGLLADLLGELHDARNPRRVFELALFRLVKFREMIRPEEILRRLESLERRLRAPHAVSLRDQYAETLHPAETQPVTAPKPPRETPDATRCAQSEGVQGEPGEEGEKSAIRITLAETSAAPAPARGETALSGSCLDLLREFSRQTDRVNPFFSRVLKEVVGAEIIDNTLRFWLLPKSKYHRASIEKSYSEEILAFFGEAAKRALRLECRFTDEGGFDAAKFDAATPRLCPAHEQEVRVSGAARTRRAQSEPRLCPTHEQEERKQTERISREEALAPSDAVPAGRQDRQAANGLLEKLKTTFGGEIVSEDVESADASWSDDEAIDEADKYE